MLTTPQIEYMRETAERAFPDSLTRYSLTTVHLPTGGTSQEWLAMSSTNCRLAPLAQDLKELVKDSSYTVDQTLVLVPAEYELNPTDRVEIGSVTYEVTGVRAPRVWAINKLARITRVAEAHE